MSHQVQIDYKQLAVQCHIVCEIAQTRLKELDEMVLRAENGSKSFLNEQSKLLAGLIRAERDKLQEQIENVLHYADEQATRGVVSVDNETGEYRHSRDGIKVAEELRRNIDELAATKLVEFEGLLTTLLSESIAESLRKMRERGNGTITIDSATQATLDGIGDGVLRQFVYLAYLKDNTLSGDALIRAGQALSEETYESRIEMERAKIRAELEAAKLSAETVEKTIGETDGSSRGSLIALRQTATNEIVGEKMRQKSLKIIMKAIETRGFIIDKKNIKIKRDSDEVIMVALKASGEKAEFRVFMDGRFIYDFRGYEGQACQKDIQPFMRDLEEVYGVKITKQTEIWSNPDKISTMKYQAINTNKNKR